MDRGRHILNRLILPSTYCNNSFQHQRRRGSRRVWIGHFKTAGPCFSSRWCIKVSCAGKICKRNIASDLYFTTFYLASSLQMESPSNSTATLTLAPTFPTGFAEKWLQMKLRWMWKISSCEIGKVWWNIFEVVSFFMVLY